jgi:hypothetical protein
MWSSSPEILGIVTGAIRLLETGLKVLEYVKEFCNALEEQQKLVAEIVALKPMLFELEKRVRVKPASQALQEMKKPLFKLKVTVEHFAGKLSLQTGDGETFRSGCRGCCGIRQRLKNVLPSESRCV